jgi:hypothetical protein
MVRVTPCKPLFDESVQEVTIPHGPTTVGAKRTRQVFVPSQKAGRTITTLPGPVNVAVTSTALKGSA